MDDVLHRLKARAAAAPIKTGQPRKDYEAAFLNALSAAATRGPNGEPGELPNPEALEPFGGQVFADRIAQAWDLQLGSRLFTLEMALSNPYDSAATMEAVAVADTLWGERRHVQAVDRHDIAKLIKGRRAGTVFFDAEQIDPIVTRLAYIAPSVESVLELDILPNAFDGRFKAVLEFAAQRKEAGNSIGQTLDFVGDYLPAFANVRVAIENGPQDEYSAAAAAILDRMIDAAFEPHEVVKFTRDDVVQLAAVVGRYVAEDQDVRKFSIYSCTDLLENHVSEIAGMALGTGSPGWVMNAVDMAVADPTYVPDAFARPAHAASEAFGDCISRSRSRYQPVLLSLPGPLEEQRREVLDQIFESNGNPSLELLAQADAISRLQGDVGFGTPTTQSLFGRIEGAVGRLSMSNASIVLSAYPNARQDHSPEVVTAVLTAAANGNVGPYLVAAGIARSLRVGERFTDPTPRGQLQVAQDQYGVEVDILQYGVAALNVEALVAQQGAEQATPEPRIPDIQ